MKLFDLVLAVLNQKRICKVEFYGFHIGLFFRISGGGISAIKQ